MNPWATFWAAWAAAGLLVEALALHGSRQRRDTLSRNIQWLLAVGHPVARALGLTGWAVFAVWFAFHIWG